MKRVTYAGKYLLVEDGAADTLMEYARLLADNDHTDTVTLASISPDGNTVEASFLLTPATILMIESTNSALTPPDNAEAIAEMQHRIDALIRPTPLVPETDPPRLESGTPE